MNNSKNTLVQITKNGMGEGDEVLGMKLMGNYLKILLEDDRLPRIIVFYNGGVKLIVKGSPVLEVLQEMQKRGVQLVACKTCIEYFNLTNEVDVGTVGTMMDIITLQSNAEKVVNV